MPEQRIKSKEFTGEEGNMDPGDSNNLPSLGIIIVSEEMTNVYDEVLKVILDSELSAEDMYGLAVLIGRDGPHDLYELVCFRNNA